MINEKDAPVGYVATAPLIAGGVGQCVSQFREDKQNVIFVKENK